MNEKHTEFDQLNRPLHDLRLSVTNACNFRCSYCMPAANHYRSLTPGELLNVEELTRLVGCFARLGVTKIRLTGGEPLLRQDLPELIAAICTAKGIEDIALSTNGYRLAECADALYTAGLRRINVSMDSIDPAEFARRSGVNADLQRVLNGLEVAVRAGLGPVKLNAVVQKGITAEAILDMVEFARKTGYILRFIEYMDVGTLNGWHRDDVVPSAQILAWIRQRYELRPVPAHYFGEVACRYLFADGGGEVGFISSVTQPFCSQCTRARVSANGTLYTCLFASSGTDLRMLLRNGASDDEITNVIANIWRQRADRYSEERATLEPDHRPPTKAEMYAVGG